MTDNKTTISQLRELIQKFREKRGWLRYDVNNPATFAKDIVVEASELLEHFVWDDKAALEDPSLMQEIKYEVADILWGVLVIADTLQMDLSTTLKEKMKLLEKKYPALKCKKLIENETKLHLLKYYKKRKKAFKIV